MTALLTPELIQHSKEAITTAAREIIPLEVNRTKVSEWAEENRVLTEGPFQGPFNFDTTPYLREMADALSPSDTETREVVFMKPARVGATVSVGENWIGATIDAFPCDMGYITSDTAMAEIQMQSRIDSLINESGIGHKIGQTKKRAGQKKTGDKTVMKQFPGGSLLAGGPNSSFFKRSVGFKFLNITEVDGFEDNIGKEGDPVGLFRRRCGAFSNDYKILWESSPKLKHNSKIHRLYREGDQRKYMVECKHCGHMQFLRWGKPDEPGGLRFDYDEEDRLICERNKEGKIISSSVRYECEKCGGEWKNSDKDFFLPDRKMGGSAYWKPTVIPRKPEIKSYHLNALYAPVGFISWEQIVMEFLEIKHAGKPKLELQVWINTVLGEPFEDRGERPKIETIITRKKSYSVDTLPEDADPLFVYLTADVQADRIECEICAWGKDGESWSINYHKIPGDTSDSSAACWTALRDLIQKEHCGMKPLLSGIDSGYRTNIVYKFCASFESGVYPMMGEDVIDKGKAYFKIFPIKGFTIPRIDVNTDILKQEVYEDLSKGRFEDGSTPRGFCHFPKEYNRQHFNQLTAEDQVDEFVNGKVKRKWDSQGRRNEQLDCRVYQKCLLYVHKQLIQDQLIENYEAEEDYVMSWDDFWVYISDQ